MQTIIKLDPRVEITPSGAQRIVYRQRVFKPNHPDYAKELKLKKDHEDAMRSKLLTINPKDK